MEWEFQAETASREWKSLPERPASVRKEHRAEAGEKGAPSKAVLPLERAAGLVRGQVQIMLYDEASQGRRRIGSADRMIDDSLSDLRKANSIRGRRDGLM